MKKIDTIRSRVPEGGLIIFDEAHLLSRRRLDELRYFPDQCSIALAFMGNLTGYKELVDAKIGQIMSRVGGSRVVVDLPTEGDVDALLNAWEIRGRKVREMAIMIGVQDGGLRLLANTARVARQFAKVKGKAIDEDIFKAAAVACGAWGGLSLSARPPLIAIVSTNTKMRIKTMTNTFCHEARKPNLRKF